MAAQGTDCAFTDNFIAKRTSRKDGKQRETFRLIREPLKVCNKV
jgi:hypothetical protein